MRFIWPWGGSLLDSKFKSNLVSAQSQTGLNFRQELMKYMPSGIVDYDHIGAVNALAQDKLAMFTEMSRLYSTLVDPKDYKIFAGLRVTAYPKKTDGRKPAMDGVPLASPHQLK